MKTLVLHKIVFNRRNRAFIFGAFFGPLMLIAFCACGRESKIYPGMPTVTAQATPPASPPADTIITITDGRSDLPSGFFDQSVNQAKIDLALDGTTATSVAARLETYPTTNSQGSFNGTGTGNRALLGNVSYSKKKLSDISSVTFDAKSAVGSEAVSVLLLVDIDCTGAAVRLFIADGGSLAPGSAQTSGYTRFNADFSSNVWRVSGAAIIDTSTSPATTLVPSSSGASTASLSSFLTKHPNACIENVASTDDTLPKNAPLGGVLLALGADTTTNANTVFINRISIGTDTVEPADWGTK